MVFPGRGLTFHISVTWIYRSFFLVLDTSCARWYHIKRNYWRIDSPVDLRVRFYSKSIGDCPKASVASHCSTFFAGVCWLPSLALYVVASLARRSDGFLHRQRENKPVFRQLRKAMSRRASNPSPNLRPGAGTRGRTRPTMSGWLPSARSTNTQTVGTGSEAPWFVPVLRFTCVF
jgi:hypothetical protein